MRLEREINDIIEYADYASKANDFRDSYLKGRIIEQLCI